MSDLELQLKNYPDHGGNRLPHSCSTQLAAKLRLAEVGYRAAIPGTEKVFVFLGKSVGRQAPFGTDCQRGTD